MNKRAAVLILATLLLAACSSAPTRKTGSNGGGYLAGDGPGANIPVNLDAIPDAMPKNEPLNRYANRPYVALGKTYTPLTSPGNFKERGIASWYGKKFNGQRTSSGETYDMYAMSAAHPTLPLPSYARVTNLSNHRSVIVRVNDRGPFLNDRIIDLSYAAAYKLGFIGDGSTEVEVESLAANATPASSEPAPGEPAQSKPPESSAPVVPVTVAPASTPPVALTSLQNSDTNVYLQLGAFESQQNAESFLARMRTEFGNTGKQLKLSTTKDGLVRVHIGPYANLGEARSSAEGMQGKLGFKPMVNLP